MNAMSVLPAELASTKDISGIPDAMAASYWDEQSQLTQDYIIIGGGIVGLSTAVTLQEMEPEAHILVLEQGVLPAGASTRNAGFACFGSLTEILEDIAVMGKEAALSQVHERWHGLNLLRDALGDEAIGFQQAGNYELISEELLPKLQHLHEINDLLRPLFGADVFIRTDECIEHFGFAKHHVQALVLNRFEGHLDSGKMMAALQRKALSLGIMIRYGCEASRPRNSTEGLEIPVANSYGKTLLFRCKAAAICTNGYTNQLLPELDIKPGRGQIIVTEPFAKPLRFNAPCHMGKGFWYFRSLPDNRILLGGGRNLNFSQETTTKLSTTPDITGPLKAILQQIIVPGETPRIDYSWAGVMGFTADHAPKIHVVSGQTRLIVGFACNGMGVARGYGAGQKVAECLRSANTNGYYPKITAKPAPTYLSNPPNCP